MQIEIANLQRLYNIKKNDVKKILKAVLKDVGKDAELSIVFVDDKKIKELNKSFLGKNTSTDVLAFPLGDFSKDENEKVSGEIVVSVETAIEVAEKMNSDVTCEIYLYLVHGLLHLMGYDDKEKTMAGEMHDEERRILSGFGLEVSFDVASML
ncbi:MAG: rRNA maturation RNase YbeY [Candidatus Anammoxibacter sp.]